MPRIRGNGAFMYCGFCGVRAPRGNWRRCLVCGHALTAITKGTGEDMGTTNGTSTSHSEYYTAGGNTITLLIKGSGTRLDVRNAQGEYRMSRTYAWDEQARAENDFNGLVALASAEYCEGVIHGQLSVTEYGDEDELDTAEVA